MDTAARLEQLADEHLQTMGFLDWDQCARDIRDRHPRPAGETFGFEEEEVYFELSDSYAWAGDPDGDIIQTIKAWDIAGNSAKRVRRIAKPPG
jgi:hypothetical protein